MFAVGILACIFVTSIVQKAIWFAVGVVGIVAGGSVGVLLWSSLVVAGLFANAPWTMILFAAIFAVIGGVMTFKWGKEMIAIATSIIGSYTFMRGSTLIFGGYPNESDIWTSL